MKPKSLEILYPGQLEDLKQSIINQNLKKLLL